MRATKGSRMAISAAASPCLFLFLRMPGEQTGKRRPPTGLRDGVRLQKNVWKSHAGEGMDPLLPEDEGSRTARRAALPQDFAQPSCPLILLAAWQSAASQPGCAGGPIALRPTLANGL